MKTKPAASFPVSTSPPSRAVRPAASSTTLPSTGDCDEFLLCVPSGVFFAELVVVLCVADRGVVAPMGPSSCLLPSAPLSPPLKRSPSSAAPSPRSSSYPPWLVRSRVRCTPIHTFGDAVAPSRTTGKPHHHRRKNPNPSSRGNDRLAVASIASPCFSSTWLLWHV